MIYNKSFAESLYLYNVLDCRNAYDCDAAKVIVRLGFCNKAKIAVRLNYDKARICSVREDKIIFASYGWPYSHFINFVVKVKIDRTDGLGGL